MTESELLHDYFALAANAEFCLSTCGPGTDEYEEWKRAFVRLRDEYHNKLREDGYYVFPGGRGKDHVG